MSGMRRLAFLATLLASSTAVAQPWTGSEHELSLQATSEFQFSSRTFEGDLTLSGIPAQSWRQRLGATYVPIENLEIRADLTWQLDRYTGPQTGVPGVILAHGPYDDGDWHGNLTDLTAAAMYTAYDGAITIAPAINTRIPVGDYDPAGYASPGTGLNEVGAGLKLGKSGLLEGKLLFWGGYNFTFVQKYKEGGSETSQFRTNYSTVDFNGGYFLSEALVLSAGAEYRLTHDGFKLEDYPSLPADSELRALHDPVLKRDYLALNVRGAYWINETLTAALAFSIIPIGDNVSDAKVIALQLGWTALEGD
jgi:hypothetical protein